MFSIRIRDRDVVELDHVVAPTGPTRRGRGAGNGATHAGSTANKMPIVGSNGKVGATNGVVVGASAAGLTWTPTETSTTAARPLPMTSHSGARQGSGR